MVTEKLKIYTDSTLATLKRLTEEHDLVQWKSWQQYRHTFETQLTYFAGCNSHKICGNSDHDAMNALHELRSRITLLDPSRLISPPELGKEVQALL